MLVGDIVRKSARNYANKICLTDDGCTFSYGEIDSRVNRLANSTIRIGLTKGDRVAVLLRNGHHYVETYFALAKAGLVIVPINVGLSADEATEIVRQAECVCCIFDDEHAVQVNAMRQQLARVEHYIGTNVVEPGDHIFEALLARESDHEPVSQPGTEDLALIMYTSGTTNAAKGVVATHRNIVANINTMTIELRIVPEDVTLLFMPLFHNGGLWPLLTHFYRGGSVVLHSRFEEAQVLAAIEVHRVTVLNLVPTMMTRLLAHPDFAKTELSSLRLVMHGGGPITRELLRQMMQVFGAKRVYTSLGCTEANGMLTSFPTQDHVLEGPLAGKIGSVGREAIGVEIRILGEDGREVAPGEVGEIVARGDNISPGYWKMLEETAATFQRGWLHTGDLAYRDTDGFIFVVGRKKDIIISGGENIACAEVEQAIAEHPSVREVAVVGVPDEKWGEAVTALVLLHPSGNAPISEQELLAFCRNRLTAFKRPKRIRFVDDFPRTSLGKIDKGSLRKIYAVKR